MVVYPSQTRKCLCMASGRKMFRKFPIYIRLRTVPEKNHVIISILLAKGREAEGRQKRSFLILQLILALQTSRMYFSRYYSNFVNCKNVHPIYPSSTEFVLLAIKLHIKPVIELYTPKLFHC